MAQRFPKEIYVTVDQNDDTADNEKGLLAWRKVEEGVEDCGPTYIAVYRLVEIKQMTLIAKEAS